MLKRSDIPISFVSGAAGAQIGRQLRPGIDRIRNLYRLLLDTVPMRFWTAAEATGTLMPANPATKDRRGE